MHACKQWLHTATTKRWLDAIAAAPDAVQVLGPVRGLQRAGAVRPRRAKGNQSNLRERATCQKEDLV